MTSNIYSVKNVAKKAPTTTVSVLTLFAAFLASLPQLIADEGDLAGYSGQDPAVDAWITAADASLAVSKAACRAVLASAGQACVQGGASGEADRALIRVAQVFHKVIETIDPEEVTRLGELQAGLETRGFDPVKLGIASGVIIDTLRLALTKERDTRAEALFRADVEAGRIQFRLRLDGNNWPMPDHVLTIEPANSPDLTGGDGAALNRSLFSPVYRSELNGEEQNVAVHLDGDAAVKWWHRNVAKANYGLQGWKRGRIYPDFIFATGGNAGAGRVVVLETKGDHLQNPDTDYKRAVLNFLTESFAWDQAVPAGQLQIEMTGETVECALVLMENVQTRLPALVAGRP